MESCKAKSDTDREFIELAYQLILKRSADPDGLRTYSKALASGLAPVELLRALLASEEYQIKSATYDYRSDPDIAPHLTPAVIELSARLRACHEVPWEKYERAWYEIFVETRDHVIGQVDYGRIHKKRFWELANAVSLLTNEKNCPRTLEIGASEFSGIYRKLFPEIRLEIIDRPYAADYIGFTEDVCRRVSLCDAFHAIDLADTSSLNSALESLSQYDLILLTEVLEHLQINPLDLLTPLIQHLHTDGSLYLTTPNFFAFDKTQQIEAWRNPSPVFPRGAENWDAHHHYREYAAKELFEFIHAAGGRVSAFYFSACWDQEERAAHFKEHPDQLGNMVFVIMRQ